MNLPLARREGAEGSSPEFVDVFTQPLVARTVSSTLRSQNFPPFPQKSPPPPHPPPPPMGGRRQQSVRHTGLPEEDAMTRCVDACHHGRCVGIGRNTLRSVTPMSFTSPLSQGNCLREPVESACDRRPTRGCQWLLRPASLGDYSAVGSSPAASSPWPNQVWFSICPGDDAPIACRPCPALGSTRSDMS